MLQLPVPELKTRTVSISHLTRQLDAATGCFFFHQFAVNTCLLALASSPTKCPLPGCATPRPTSSNPAASLCPWQYTAQPPYFGEGERDVQWRSGMVTQKGNRIIHFMLPSPASPCLVPGSQEVQNLCLPQETHRVSHQQFLPLFSSAHTLVHQLLQSCVDNSTRTLLTSSSAGKHP